MADWWHEVEPLELTMSQGWPALETGSLGRWLLRASYGFTSRGNSALTLGEPGVPYAEAITRTEQWYAARQLAPLFCVLTDPLGRPLSAELVGTLDRAGYGSAHATVTMTVPTAQLASAVASRPPARTRRGARVISAPTPSPAWLVAFGRYRQVPPALTGVAARILTGSPEQLFLGVPADAQHPTGELVANCRLSMHEGWVGIHAMWVHAGRRRLGLASALLGAAAAHAGGRERVYLQVERDNLGALAAYRKLAFVEHHGHVYRRR